MIQSMMAAVLYLVFGVIKVHIPSFAYMLMYLAFGVMTVRFLLPRHRPLNRIWLGLSLGLLEEMWLPALFAFFFGFTALAHTAAAGALLVITLLCYFGRDRRDPVRWDRKECTHLVQMLLVVLPLTILGAYLQYTHVMRVDSAGNWNVGQSTYGDLPMHMSFITNLAGKKFPADYPFYPGVQLSYPFLTDTLSSTFYLLGANIQSAVIIPAVVMMFLCYAGVMVLAREMSAGKKTVMLAALLFFLNGGLGFIYDFDLAGGRWEVENVTRSGEWLQAGVGGRMRMLAEAVGEQKSQIFSGYFSELTERIRNILEGYYKTPTNQPDPNNLRWSNVICDLMVPQRTLLGGWCMVIPCFYLFSTALRPRRVFEASYERAAEGLRPVPDNRALILLAVWAGALPLIHTHSFVALALMSLGAMVYDLIHGDPKELMIRRTRGEILLRYAVYGLIAGALAMPQLVFFTFDQALGSGSSRSFMTIQFNWVNVSSWTTASGSAVYQMKDLYFWFYIKNIGIPFIVLLLALFEKNPRHRRIFAMMFPVILAAELIRFQPNAYDNNKLLYLAWMMGCIVVADWCGTVWKKLKGLRGRYALAVLAAVVTFLSAGLTIWRECKSDYQAFNARAVEAGEFARKWTSPDAVFLTGSENHLNPVLSIGGKTIVCGPNLWLYWHGFDTGDRQNDIRLFYEDPEHHADILQKYQVDYIYVSWYERSQYDLDEEAIRRNYPLVFENTEAAIYQVPEG